MGEKTAADDVVHRAGRRIAEEARRFLLMFLYLWAILFLFVLNENVVLRQKGMSISVQGFALINSLVLAKVMLVVEDLDLGRWLPRRPLIFPIVHEALLLTALFILFHVVENIVIGYFKHETVSASVPHIGGGGFIGLCLVAAILFIALLPFFAFKHISRAIGEARMREMLFGPRTSPGEKSE